MITSRSLCRGGFGGLCAGVALKALASAVVSVSRSGPGPSGSSSGRLLRSVASSVPVLPCITWIPSGPLSSVGGLWQKRRLPWARAALSLAPLPARSGISCKRPGTPHAQGLPVCRPMAPESYLLRAVFSLPYTRNPGLES